MKYPRKISKLNKDQVGEMHRRTRRGAGRCTCPPPLKIFLMKTRKNENSSKLREQPFAEEFSEMGVGVRCRLVGHCRARLLLSGMKVNFVGAKDRKTSHLPRSFHIWDGLGVSSRQ